MKNLSDYIHVYKSLSPEDCKSVIESLEDEWWERHEFSYHSGGQYSHDNELDTSDQYNETLDKTVYCSLKLYCAKYNIPGWNGFTPVRLNRYSPGTEMHYHDDRLQLTINGVYKGQPTLSVVGLLNDDYTGGDFVMFDDYKVKLSVGDVMIFPSSFMYPHKVTKVTNGTRFSFVSWAW